jgi:succinate dehydrogenase hydrophobic anchor subunit
MKQSTQPGQRFLGRPDDAYPGFVPGDSILSSTTRPKERSRAGRIWLVQAMSGALLLLFLSVHLIAQHLLVPGGLRDYASVVDYLRNPLALAAEIGLLASVIVHAVIGLRSTLIDVVGGTALRRISVALVAAGTVAFGYAIWLTLVVTTAAGI